MYNYTMTNTTEASMTAREIQNEIDTLQGQVNAAVNCLILLQEVATERGILHRYPMFEDCTIKSLLNDYQKLKKLRGY